MNKGGKDADVNGINILCNASIVLYNTRADDIAKLVGSLNLCSSFAKVYFVDNSPRSELLPIIESFSPHFNYKYIHLPENPGFGAGHNVSLRMSLEDDIAYHAIINPDVHFSSDVLVPMLRHMNQHRDTGMIMPQILNHDGTIQNLPKLLPTPFGIIYRKLNLPIAHHRNFMDRYELRKSSKDTIYNAPILSGCFTVLKLSAIRDIGMYDEKYFMYFEDWDLSRRMHRTYKTIYFPKVSVIHGYESGANKNRKLFMVFIKSAIAYFNKWGWFFDSERNKFNKQALSQLK